MGHNGVDMYALKRTLFFSGCSICEREYCFVFFESLCNSMCGKFLLPNVTKYQNILFLINKQKTGNVMKNLNIF